VPERMRRHRASRTVRPVRDWDPKSKTEVTAFRIEWQDRTPTGTGLFVGREWAQRYAENRGWMVDVDHEEECA
jgi:hypothetical protein